MSRLKRKTVNKTQRNANKKKQTNKQTCITCLLRMQWDMKIIRPWRELNMVNIYLKIMVSELKLNNPNSQVIPSNGRMTPEALTPVLTFSTCVLFCIYFVPIIWRITKIKTTILTCKSYRNCMYFAPIIWRITKINTTILTCKSCKNFGR